jgi:hypothetical protein
VAEEDISKLLNKHEKQLKELLADDGIALNLEEVRLSLSQLIQTKVDMDEPTMMVAFMINAFLRQFGRLFASNELALAKFFESHKKALTELMNAETAKQLEAVGHLDQQISRLSAEGIQEISKSLAQSFTETFSALTGLKHEMYWLAGIMVLSAVFNIVFLVVKT